MTVRAITVYCASSSYLDPEFHDVARAVGEEIGRRGLQLTYGGGSTGLMGEVARAAKDNGAIVHGIITTRLCKPEVAWDGCDELQVVDTMRERKRLLAESGDAFIILPGGLGTYEEFFEILVGRQLGEDDKLIGIVNAHSYYDPLLAMIEHGIEHRFIKPALRELFVIDAEPVTVIDRVLQRERHNLDDSALLPHG